MGTSLLVSGSASCTTNDPLCSTLPDTSTEGELAIQADTVPAVNMDKSDVVEITGTCVDLGRKKNRILVEVFAGDLDESVDPYISNGITSNCYHINGGGITTSSGISSSDKCFWVTKGVGLTEDAGLPSQKDFPQCHNGQFGFAIKLGKILNDTSSPLGTNYLVRYKLRTDDGIVSDSAWTRTPISRQLTPPKITSTLPKPANFSCQLAMDISRFNPFLTYSLTRDYKLLGGGATAPTAIPSYTSVNSLTSISYSYEDFNLVDGVTYNYNLSVDETQYAPYAPLLTPMVSIATPCKTLPPPIVSSNIVPPTGSCLFYLANYNFDPSVKYEIGFSDVDGWSKKPQPYVFTPTACSSGSLSSTCTRSGLISGKKFYFAVRSYRDQNGNSTPDILSEEVGEWSHELNCIPP